MGAPRALHVALEEAVARASSSRKSGAGGSLSSESSSGEVGLGVIGQG